MKSIVENKINSIKTLSTSAKVNSDFIIVKKNNIRCVNDNLSRSIRNEKDAAIFIDELKIAIKMAKK